MGYAFDQAFAYDATGKLAGLTYPDCTHAPCAGVDPARTVTYEYGLGFLTAVPGYADSITYHQNGLWSEIEHSNGVTDDQNRDPDGFLRPKRIRTFGAVDGQGNQAEFDTLVYNYDGAGNVKSIGPNTFIYDEVSRVVEGQAAGQTQQYDFDLYGNINSVTTDDGSGPVTYATFTDPTTNRLQSATYDTAGNMTARPGFTYEYDALKRLRSQTYPGGETTYLYTVDGERIWTLADSGDLAEAVHLRSLAGKLLRTYEISDRDTSETWSWQEDYVFRGGGQLASERSGGSTLHYHRDHLGSTRMLTGTNGLRLDALEYLPFGSEAIGGSSSQALHFTGHERDHGGPGTSGVMDYMHARYYSPHIARFTRFDPVAGDASLPQRLNRYAYALNAPLTFTDPDSKNPAVSIAVQFLQDVIYQTAKDRFFVHRDEEALFDAGDLCAIPNYYCECPPGVVCDMYTVTADDPANDDPNDEWTRPGDDLEHDGTTVGENDTDDDAASSDDMSDDEAFEPDPEGEYETVQDWNDLQTWACQISWAMCDVGDDYWHQDGMYCDVSHATCYNY